MRERGAGLPFFYLFQELALSLLFTRKNYIPIIKQEDSIRSLLTKACAPEIELQ